MKLPDPDTFGGPLHLKKFGGDWRHIRTGTRIMGGINWPPAEPSIANYRFAGLADMGSAIRLARPARADAQLALHVLEILTAIETAARSGAGVDLMTVAERPQPIDAGEDWLPG